MGRHNPKTAPKRIIKLERAAQALELRKQGWQFPEIAEALGVSTPCAFKYVNQYLEQLRKQAKSSAEELRDLELHRMDDMQNALWEKVLKGDRDSIQSVIKISERRSKLLGLDKPLKVAETTPDGDEKQQQPVQNVNYNFESVEEAAEFYEQMTKGKS